MKKRIRRKEQMVLVYFLESKGKTIELNGLHLDRLPVAYPELVDTMITINCEVEEKMERRKKTATVQIRRIVSLKVL